MKKQKKETVYTLDSQKREVFGKKLKSLRKRGKIPGNIYGENFKSQAIDFDSHEFNKLFRKTGETQLITLKLADTTVPVLVHEVQKHPISDQILHVEFRKVDLLKKIETEVPISLVGESPAVMQNKGVLLTPTESVLIEALPDHIPQKIEVDISGLNEVGDEIKVSNLKVSSEYEFKDDPEKILVSIIEHKEEEVTPQVEAVETEITEQKSEVAAEEQEEGQEKKEDKKESQPKEEKGNEDKNNT